MELSGKLFPFYILLLVVWHMATSVLYARRYASTGDTHYITLHKGEMQWAMVWLAMTVFAITLMRRTGMPPTSYQSVFWVHLPLVLAAVGIFVAIFAHFDGERTPRVHPMLGYISISCLALGAILGLYMAVQM